MKFLEWWAVWLANNILWWWMVMRIQEFLPLRCRGIIVVRILLVTREIVEEFVWHFRRARSNKPILVLIRIAIMVREFLNWNLFIVTDGYEQGICGISCVCCLRMLLSRQSKKHVFLLSPVTSPNIDRLSKFFHQRTQQWLYNKVITKYPTAP